MNLVHEAHDEPRHEAFAFSGTQARPGMLQHARTILVTNQLFADSAQLAEGIDNTPPHKYN